MLARASCVRSFNSITVPGTLTSIYIHTLISQVSPHVFHSCSPLATPSIHWDHVLRLIVVFLWSPSNLEQFLSCPPFLGSVILTFFEKAEPVSSRRSHKLELTHCFLLRRIRCLASVCMGKLCLPIASLGRREIQVGPILITLLKWGLPRVPRYQFPCVSAAGDSGRMGEYPVPQRIFHCELYLKRSLLPSPTSSPSFGTAANS